MFHTVHCTNLKNWLPNIETAGTIAKNIQLGDAYLIILFYALNRYRYSAKLLTPGLKLYYKFQSPIRSTKQINLPQSKDIHIILLENSCRIQRIAILSNPKYPLSFFLS